ncbi:MAG: AAA15 family ATPase/GTPase [Phenylobacterium sp.]|jgi:AAA15 family ATPase/GTPase
MLKRIQTIQNVGTFREFEDRTIEMGKITLIYGRNTFGKATLIKP